MSVFEPIGLGRSADDGMGDTARVAGEKLNRMLASLYARIADLEDRLALIEHPPAPLADFTNPTNSALLGAVIF